MFFKPIWSADSGSFVSDRTVEIDRGGFFRRQTCREAAGTTASGGERRWLVGGATYRCNSAGIWRKGMRLAWQMRRYGSRRLERTGGRPATKIGGGASS